MLEDVGLPFQLVSQSLHELTVLFHLFAFHDHNNVVLNGKLLAELQVDFVVLLLPSDQIIAVGPKLQAGDGVPDTEEGQEKRRPAKPGPMLADRSRQPSENSRRKRRSFRAGCKIRFQDRRCPRAGRPGCPTPEAQEWTTGSTEEFKPGEIPHWNGSLSRRRDPQAIRSTA